MRLKLILPLILFPLLSMSQNDNSNFFKLIIFNSKNEILLVKWENEWEVMGERYNKPLSITRFLNQMAEGVGVSIQRPQLCALFTQQSNSQTNLTVMHYYKALYIDGQIKPPSDCTDIKWYSFEDAIKIIPYQIMTSVLVQIDKNPQNVINADFRILRDNKNKIVDVKTVENFSLINQKD